MIIDFLLHIAKKTNENPIIIGVIVIFAAIYFTIKWIFQDED